MIFKFFGRLRDTWVVFLFLGLAVSNIQAAPQKTIGKVIAAVGDVVAVAGTSHHALKRGSAIHAQETLRTGNDGFAQVRFVDNTLIALSANTVFQVDQYAFNHQEPKKDHFVATLAKGTFKALTGTIAQHQPDQFRIHTQVATIAVRGTGFLGQYTPQNKQLVTGVFKGGINLIQCQGGNPTQSCSMRILPLTAAEGKIDYGRATESGLVRLPKAPKALQVASFVPNSDTQEDLEQVTVAASFNGFVDRATDSNDLSVVSQEEAINPDEPCEGEGCNNN